MRTGVTVIRSVIVLCMMSAVLAGCVGIQLNPRERSLSQAVDDVGIQATFNARMLRENSSLFARIDSTVTEGRVHITGTVPTQEDRQNITRIAWAVPSVTEVVNDVEVASSPGLADAARDRWITAKLRAILVADGTIRDSNYAIDTSTGTIYLNGIAQDPRERDRVVRHAQSIPEARRVVDYIIMKDDPRRATGARAGASPGGESMEASP